MREETFSTISSVIPMRKTPLPRSSRLASGPSLYYFILQAQSKQLYMQFLRTIHPLSEKERKVLHGHIRHEFDKAKMRQIYMPLQDASTEHTDTTTDAENINAKRQIDYDAMEKLIKERLQVGNSELKRLKEMVAMSIGAAENTKADAKTLGLMETDDVVPIEDPKTQWLWPEKSPYDD